MVAPGFMSSSYRKTTFMKEVEDAERAACLSDCGGTGNEAHSEIQLRDYDHWNNSKSVSSRFRKAWQGRNSAKYIVLILVLCLVLLPAIFVVRAPEVVLSTAERFLPLSHMDADQLLPITRSSRVGQVSLLYGSGDRWNPDVPKPSGADGKKPTHREESGNDLSLKIRKRYCKKWGYPLWVGTHPFISGPEKHHMTMTYTKQALVLSVLLGEMRKPKSQRLEWIFWFDGDAVIINDNVPLETFLPRDDEYGRSIHVLIARDQWGTMNTGVYAVRVSELGVKIVSSSVAWPTLIEPKTFWDNGDQTSMTSSLRTVTASANVSIVPAFWFNADPFALFDPHHNGYKRWQPIYQYGDFMIHFMDYPKNNFIGLAKQVLKGYNATLMPPLSQTRYMKGENNVEDWYKSQAKIPLADRIARVVVHNTGPIFEG